MKNIPSKGLIKDIVIRFFISFVCAAVLYMLTVRVRLKDIIPLVGNISLLSFYYGIIFSVFVVLALSLIISRESQSWFGRFKKTRAYRELFLSFNIAFTIAVICIFVGTLSKFIGLEISRISVYRLILSMNVFLILFGFLWILRCFKLLMVVVRA